MGTFLLILLLVLIYFMVAPVMRVWRKVRDFQDEFNSAMNNTGSASQQQQQQGGRSRNVSDEQREMIERYRRYTQAHAENVDFEELDGPMQEEPQQESMSNNSRPSSYQEEEISDAEFEEV